MLQSAQNLSPRRAGISLLLAMLLAGCSGEKPEQFLAKARQQYDGGNKTAAVIELKNAVQSNPDYTEARLFLGKIYVEQGDGASGEKELRKALQLGADQATVLPQLGRALLLQGQFQKVLEEVQAKPGAKPADAAAVLVVRGDAHMALKQIDEARAAYEEAARLDPKQAEASQGLAMVALMQKQPDEAMRLADEAVQKSGQSADPWLLKADLLRAQGKNAEAAQAYEEALKRDPRNVGAHLSLATLHMQDRKFDAAQRAIDAARKTEPNSIAVRLTQARLDFVQQKFPQARDGLQEILKVAPNHGAAVLMMGATQLALGAYAQAETYLTTYVKAVPDNAYARRLLAATHLKSNQPAKALETLNPLLAAHTEDAAVLALAGDAYMRLKDYAKATEYLEKASKVNPANATLQTGLALSRVASGDVVRGTAELEAAAEMEGSPLQTDVALIYTLLSKRDFDKALKAIDALDKKQPNNPLVDNLRGGAYMAKQDPANARKAFEKALSINPAYYPAAANLAQLDLREKNPQAARKRMDNVLAADKNNVPAMVAIATMERNAGNEKGFVEWLDKATRADAKALQPRMLLVQHYISKKDVQRALSIAREAETANPSSIDALDMLGNAQLAAGEKDNAVATFGKLATLAPQSPVPYLRLASAHVANKNPGEARKALNKALALKPDFTEAQVALIDLDIQDKRTDEAIKRAREIQRQQPKSPIGYVIEGEIQVGQKQFAPAAELYKKAFDLDKSPLLAIKLHGALVAAGKTGEAETTAAQWLKEHPQDIAVRTYLAEHYMNQGQDKQAVAQYQAILQRSPDNLIALNNLAWLLNKQRDPQAVSYAERAYKLQPEDPAVMDTLGWVLVEQGQTARGLDLLQRALAKAPDVGDIRYHVAVALYRSGDKTRAQGELKRLLNGGTKFAYEQEARALLNQISGGR
jgi:putative PEP-CTERM system TPR-repeat lipoprotein